MLISMSACKNTVPEETVLSAINTVQPETVGAETQFVPDNLPDTLDFDGRTTTWYVGDYMSAYYNDFHAAVS